MLSAADHQFDDSLINRLINGSIRCAIVLEEVLNCRLPIIGQRYDRDSMRLGRAGVLRYRPTVDEFNYYSSWEFDDRLPIKAEVTTERSA